jgi:hypothetical protein
LHEDLKEEETTHCVHRGKDLTDPGTSGGIESIRNEVVSYPPISLDVCGLVWPLVVCWSGHHSTVCFVSAVNNVSLPLVTLWGLWLRPITGRYLTWECPCVCGWDENCIPKLELFKYLMF